MAGLLASFGESWRNCTRPSPARSPQLCHGFPFPVSNGFDPMRELFVAQGSRPAELAAVNLRTLSPFHRALLVIDGTVTKFIEAYTMEPVDVLHLGQEVRPLPTDDTWLETPRGTEVLARQVLLRAKYSRSVYAFAVSLIVPERLPDDIRRGLEIDGEGLGRLLLGSRAETYREVLWYGRERSAELPDGVRDLQGSDFLSRTYRIISHEKPIMLINEKFLLNTEPMPAHE